MLKPETIDQIRKYLSTASKTSKVYIGCDSKRYRVKDKKTGKVEWFANYNTAVVVHINSNNGCKLFTETETERDFDKNKQKPKLRMLNEAMKTAEAYIQLEEDLLDFDVEVHLDINESPKYGSNSALAEAVGYLKGVTGLTVRVKPEAWAASYAADKGTLVSV